MNDSSEVLQDLCRRDQKLNPLKGLCGALLHDNPSQKEKTNHVYYFSSSQLQMRWSCYAKDRICLHETDADCSGAGAE